MTRFKWCCGGNHAVMVAPLWPIVKDRVKWYTALYKCDKCGAYTKRGETNYKNGVGTTSVEWITKEQAQELIDQRKQMDQAGALVAELKSIPVDIKPAPTLRVDDPTLQHIPFKHMRHMIKTFCRKEPHASSSSVDGRSYQAV